MYPDKNQLEHRRLELSKMQNALLENRLQLNIQLSNIETELIAIEKLITLSDA